MIEAFSQLVRRHTGRTLLVLGGALGATLGAGACDESGGGTDPAIPISSNAFGNGSSIASILDPALRATPIANNTTVRVTGARVIHVDTFDETGNGQVGNVYLQDAWLEPGPYRAVLAFDPVYSPPSYRATVGDIVDATAPFQNFPRPVGTPRFLPELVAAKLEARFDAVGGPLQPAVVPLGDFTSFETGKKWLSALVTVENVRVLEVNINETGRSSVRLDAGAGLAPNDLPTINNELFDLAHAGISFYPGQTLARVTGLVTIFGNFSVAPRSRSDIEVGDGP
ncbi:MAG TPA: hypothetical protein VFS00_02010 [Polyangiaceae bacterium]|nr:hypothetical protein [Polyangiaceae bacterium]